ncbi:MAG: hypothetical protein ABSG64_04020 [Solirubrobacteraceae bacterium]
MSDLIAYSFSDPAAGLHSSGVQDSGAVVFADGRQSTAGAARVHRDDEQASRWTVGVDGAYEVDLQAIGLPVTFADGRREWICRVTGGAQLAGKDVQLSGFGRVALAQTDLGDAGLRRAIWMVFGEELAFALAAERPRRASGHGQELLSAFVLRGAELEATPIADPRLSSTYGEDGRLLRAGLELWRDDEHEERSLRIGAETLAAGELSPRDGLTTSVAFLVCHHGGTEGIGCYEITRGA